MVARSLSELLRQQEEFTKPASDLGDILEEEPVPLTEFVTGRRYLNNPPLSAVQFDAVRHIERIYYPEIYPMLGREVDPYWAEPVRMTNFITLQWGKGSGKDHICRMAALRIAYLLQCLKDPQKYYGLPAQDTIHMLNVASSSSQANQAYFVPMTRAVKQTWFADKCDPKPGLGLITWRKNIEMVSGHADAESQEGLNIILGVADELDAFKTKEEFMRFNNGREPVRSAENILKMIRTSGSTRFPETFKTVRISYPRYLGSTIQRLTDQAHKDNRERGTKSRHYVSGPLPTWVVNPRYKNFEMINIPGTDALVPNVASIVEDYEEDPVMAKSMYECKPSRAVDTYFKNMDAVRAAVVEDASPVRVSYRTQMVTSEITNIPVEVWEPVYEFAEDFVPVAGARYALHGDMAIKGDKAGLAMSHVQRWETVTTQAEDGEGGRSEVTYERPVVKTDFMIAYSADAGATPIREIQIRWARMLVFELIRRGFNIVYMSFDGFQSADSLQILNGHGIEAKRVSMDTSEDPWKNWRDLLYEGRHKMPYSADLMNEVESLGRFGGKVDHPPGGSKDLADAVCGSVLGAVAQGGSEAEDGEQSYISGNTVEVGYFDYALAGMDAEDMMGLPVGLPGL